jgi:LacI family transcriptional regulator
MNPTNPRKTATPERAIGIKDIAQALGVSTGTVDRALHAKPGINPMTRARVLRMAESLGYRPNLAARYLKSRRVLRISVHLPREIALFWDSLREGIREAATLFEPTLQVDFRDYPRPATRRRCAPGFARRRRRTFRSAASSPTRPTRSA